MKTAITKENAQKLIHLVGSWPSGQRFGDGPINSTELPFGPIPKEPTTETARIIGALRDNDPVRTLWQRIKPRTRKPGIWHSLHEDADPSSSDPDCRTSTDLWWTSDGWLESEVASLLILLYEVCGNDIRHHKSLYLG